MNLLDKIPNAQSIIDDALLKSDDGELFVEYCESESISFDDGCIRNASADISAGFGLRAVKGEKSAFAYSNIMDEKALRRAANTVKSMPNNGSSCIDSTNPPLTDKSLYTAKNPLKSVTFADKVSLLKAIDAYLRTKDTRVRQVSASISGEWQKVEIIRKGGFIATDIRPLVRLNISVVLEKNGRMESGSAGVGGRKIYDEYITESAWIAQADEALRQALVNLEARPAPAGELPVLLGNSWCGVLLHEAIGHGLEGDFNRKKTSVFTDKIGTNVASKDVTIIDDGTLQGRRGSINIDDEGTPSAYNILIENGKLKNYMQDRQNARLMGVTPTGNGRRESYAYQPIPRMTNTYMLAGDASPKDMMAEMGNGIYAVNFGGGQVDITSGKFVFSASEAYMIENGRIAYPIKGATLIGTGADIMQKVIAIGNDLELDKGVGTCGKDGQSVPVGVGQPSLLIEKITVGGTKI